MKKVEYRHIIHELYGEAMDFADFPKKPSGSYVLATVPRSGSTYCAIRLWQTGLLGAPMEYLNFRSTRLMFLRLGYEVNKDGFISPDKLEEYWTAVQRLRTSPNGIFGYKLFTSNYSELAEKYPFFLQKITPNYVIYLTRRDKLGQAISYSRAQRSNVWFGGVPSTPAVEYDFSHVVKCLRSIEQQKNVWEKIFVMTGIKPIRVYYEDLLRSASVVLNTVLEAMGIRLDARFAFPVPLIARQTDFISMDWRAKYIRDAKLAGNEFETAV